MPQPIVEQVALTVMDLVIGFGLFGLGQFLYQQVFRRIALNEERFVRDNPAVAIALVGYYLGLVTALSGGLSQPMAGGVQHVQTLASYGALTLVLMLAGAWVGDHLILRHRDSARKIQQEQNLGAATVEAGLHIANRLILSTALAGPGGSWLVGVTCWGMGMVVLVGMSYLYPWMAAYNVFGEIRRRNNPAAGVALAGFLVATGNVVRMAFSPEFQNWVGEFERVWIPVRVGVIGPSGDPLGSRCSFGTGGENFG